MPEQWSKSFQKSATTISPPISRKPTEQTSPSLYGLSLLFQSLYFCFTCQSKLKQHLNIFFNRLKFDSALKCFRSIPLRKNISPFSDNCLKLQEELLAWRFPYSQRQVVGKGDIKGAGRAIYEPPDLRIPSSSCSPARPFPQGWDKAALNLFHLSVADEAKRSSVVMQGCLFTPAVQSFWLNAIGGQSCHCLTGKLHQAGTECLYRMANPQIRDLSLPQRRKWRRNTVAEILCK